MNKTFLIIVTISVVFAISFPVSSSIYAESTETFVIHSHLFDCRDIDNVPIKCLIYQQQTLNPFESWRSLYVPIEGFDYKEWNRYIISVKVTDAENSTSPAISKNYELVEILGQESFPQHDPYNKMCAPGFVATTEGDCRFNFRCGSEWSAGRICMVNGEPQPYLKPLQQVNDVGIAKNDVICVEHLNLVFKNSDGSPACVTSETLDVLVKRGTWNESVVKPNIFQQISETKLHEDDFDIPEVRLFLEKYPQAVILEDQVGYANHYKKYMYVEQSTGQVVGLFLTKNIETGKMNNGFLCPPTSHHSEGYEITGSDNIVEYLQNYDCLLDSDVGRFEPVNGSSSENTLDESETPSMRKSILELQFEEDLITVFIVDDVPDGTTSTEFTTIPVNNLIEAHDRLPSTDSSDRIMAGSILSETVKAGTYITVNNDKEFWYTIGGHEYQVITLELQDHEFDRIVFVSDKNEKLIDQINDIVNSKK